MPSSMAVSPARSCSPGISRCPIHEDTDKLRARRNEAARKRPSETHLAIDARRRRSAPGACELRGAETLKSPAVSEPQRQTPFDPSNNSPPTPPIPHPSTLKNKTAPRLLQRRPRPRPVGLRGIRRPRPVWPQRAAARGGHAALEARPQAVRRPAGQDPPRRRGGRLPHRGDQRGVVRQRHGGADGHPADPGGQRCALGMRCACGVGRGGVALANRAIVFRKP